MSPTPDERQQTVTAAMREISHIATLPEITVKIIEMVEDPKSSAQNLHKVISQDPALCSRILKVVNSSFYGLPGQIGSINRAIVMLGLNAVKNIAIAASLVKLFRGGELTPGLSARNLWDHCTLVASCSKMLSDELKLGLNDEAYLAGLVHDIGIVVELQYDRAKLIEVILATGLDSAGVPASNLMAEEDRIFGANHQDFGNALCDKWKFPKSLGYVTGYHHRPMDLPAENRTLTSVVYVADRITGVGEGRFRCDLVNLDYDPQVLDLLSISPERITQMQDQFFAMCENNAADAAA